MFWTKILLIPAPEIRYTFFQNISYFIENLGLSVVLVDHIFRHLILSGGLKRMSTTWTVLHVSFVGESWIQEMNSTSWMIKSFCASSTMKLLSPKVNNCSMKPHRQGGQSVCCMRMSLNADRAKYITGAFVDNTLVFEFRLLN